MADTPSKLKDFVNYVLSLEGDEKSESQVFCDRLFIAFGHQGYKEAGAKLEYRVKSKGKSTKYADLVWRPRLLLEMKSRGEKLDRHRQQAFDYWWELIPNNPRYVILCNFDEFWIYDTQDLECEEPIERVKLEELPKRFNALNFLFPDYKPPQPTKTYYENIPHSGVVAFVGRDKELESLHQLLYQQNGYAIAVIVGMGGVGKTELAKQYARQHIKNLGDTLGGVCWLDGRDEDIAIQVVRFARSRLNLSPPEDLDIISQVAYCWRNWPTYPNPDSSQVERRDGVLLVLDDVTDYTKIKPYLPPESSGFKILLTTRESLGLSLPQLPINELRLESAIELLTSLIGDERLARDADAIDELTKLCDWLGYLPLGLELVGKYLQRDPDLSVKEMLSRLEKKGIKHKAVQEADATMTAKWGVPAAFDLSWEKLDEDAQKLALMLSLFAKADIPWFLVKLAYNNLLLSEDERIDLDSLEEARVYLLRLNLLQRTGNKTYRLHQLLREFLREKLDKSLEASFLKCSFVAAMVAVAKQIPESPTQQQIQAVSSAIPHIVEVAQNNKLLNLITGENLVFPFEGLAHFYIGQALYSKAKPWLEKCLLVTKTRFGAEHLTTATSLNNLAYLYYKQGRYSEAENLLIEALELRKTLLGENHTDVADTLNNLGNLYKAQGRYSQAEYLLRKALEIREKTLGETHPDIASSLISLGGIYHNQSYYSKAEEFYLKGLELRKRLLGEDHPDLVSSLSNLALLYKDQGQYTKAEPLLVQALNLRKRLLGEEHPDVASSLNNLGSLYISQGRYTEAESLLLEALEVQKRFLGNEHPIIATSLNNLAHLYNSQGRYGEVEALLTQSLELRKTLLGKEHPDVAQSLSNLALFYQFQGSYDKIDKIENLYFEALIIYKKVLGECHHEVATCLNNLALFYQSQHRYNEAEKLHLKVLDMRIVLLGEQHPDVADSLWNLGILYFSQASFSKAKEPLSKALAIRQQQLGVNHPKTIESQKGVAMLRDCFKSIEKGLPNFKQKFQKGNHNKKPKGFGKL